MPRSARRRGWKAALGLAATLPLLAGALGFLLPHPKTDESSSMTQDNALRDAAEAEAPLTRRSEDARTVDIQITSTGYHAALVLPVEAAGLSWRSRLKPRAAFAGLGMDAATHVMIGWGETQFYALTPRLEDVTIPTVFRALFLSASSVLNVAFLRAPLRDAETVTLTLPEDRYESIFYFVLGTFNRDDEGGMIPIGPGYSSEDAFFDARLRYSVARTCNTWVAEALRRAHVRTPFWAALSQSVMHHAKRSRFRTLVQGQGFETSSDRP